MIDVIRGEYNKLLFSELFWIEHKAPLCKGSWIGEAKTEGL